MNGIKIRGVSLAFFLPVVTGCVSPPAVGTQWAIAGQDLKVGDSLAAILIAQDACRMVIAGLAGRERQDFFELQTRFGWRATLSNGIWHAGVIAEYGRPDCPEMGAEIDAQTGKVGSCLQCVIVG